VQTNDRQGKRQQSQQVMRMQKTQMGSMRTPYIVMTSGLVIAITVAAIACFVFINSNRVWLKYHHLSDKTPLDQIGSFIGGVSLFLATLVAWVTAYLVTERNARLERYMAAVASFRILYEEFWKPEAAIARKWIISADEYKVLRLVLENRNRKELNELDKDENAILETLDRFLSVLVRIKSFSVSKELDYIALSQRRLWRKIIHGTFWVDYAYKHRPELWTYLYRHWKEELIPPNAPEIPDLTRDLEFDDFL
jgi:hypothetical protein